MAEKTRTVGTAREKAQDARDAAKARVAKLSTQFDKTKADHDRVKSNLDDAKAELKFYNGHPLIKDEAETTEEVVEEAPATEPEPAAEKPAAKKAAAPAKAAEPEPAPAAAQPVLESGDPFEF